MAWTVTWEGRTYSGVDLTIDEAEEVVRLTGENWAYISPVHSPTHLKAIIAVLAARDGVDKALTMKRIGTMTVDEGLALTGTTDTDDLPMEYEEGIPKAEGGSSTPGSWPASDASAGPPT